MFWIECASFLNVKYVPKVCCALWMFTGGRSTHAPANCSERPYGNGLSSTPSMISNIATEAPLPMTSVSTAVTVKAGVRRSDLHAWRSGVGICGLSGADPDPTALAHRCFAAAVFRRSHPPPGAALASTSGSTRQHRFRPPGVSICGGEDHEPANDPA